MNWKPIDRFIRRRARRRWRPVVAAAKRRTRGNKERKRADALATP